MLQLERERKEYDIWRGMQEAKVEALEEELWVVEEYGEAVQAHVLELVRDSVGKSKISLVFNSNLIYILQPFFPSCARPRLRMLSFMTTLRCSRVEI